MDGKGEEGWAEEVALLHTSGQIQTEVSVKKGCFWRITVPYEGVDFWEVFLSFLKNGVSAHAVEGIFNIKFKENFVVVGLVHEVTGDVNCSFTP